MNEVIENILTRCSVRKFIPNKPIENEKLEAIINAGIAAPSAGNIQPWRVIVIKSQNLKDEITKAALNQKFISEAPLVIVVCADRKAASRAYSDRGANLYVYQDTAAMTQNMLLAAHSLGLGSCWVGAFNDRKVSEILGLPEGVIPVSIIPIGYYEILPPKTPRRNDVVEFR